MFECLYVQHLEDVLIWSCQFCFKQSSKRFLKVDTNKESLSNILRQPYPSKAILIQHSFNRSNPITSTNVILSF